MKIVRFSRRGRAQLGVLVADGLMVDLTADRHFIVREGEAELVEWGR
jgi:hypothetical protein